ncbi:MAG: hypothetical protein J7K84_10665 [Deltaproteobacteria bacterium]|nr:hypothetical protein [Deltaproteobacteria bacterium]
MACLASAYDLRYACSTFYFSCETNSKKKTLTLAMAKKLLQVILPLHSITQKGALEIIKYTIKHNNIAHQSHRKKQLNIAKKIGVQLSL